MATGLLHLQDLPNELLEDVLSRLSQKDHYQVSLSCRLLQHLVTPFLYHSIELVDQRLERSGNEHDDTPIIRMLLLFAENKHLASHVREVLHRCHLHLPDVWQDLSHMSFRSPTISRTPGLQCLLQRAIDNLCNVHTLRIIFGHHTFVVGLISGFFKNPRSSNRRPIKRLWLENCYMDVLPWDGVSTVPQSEGLETFRYRRSNALPETHLTNNDHTRIRSRFRFGLSRHLRTVHENSTRSRGTYGTTTTFDPRDGIENLIIPAEWDGDLLQKFPGLTHSNDPTVECSNHSCPKFTTLFRQPPFRSLETIIQGAADTITSLTIDWIIDGHLLVSSLVDMKMHFPQLRAFQVRNAVETLSRLPSREPYLLLSGGWLAFLSRHPNIECLAWPLECFLPHIEQGELSEAAQTIIARIGESLKTLRVDAEVKPFGEPQSSDLNEDFGQSARDRRRAFIEHVAPRMSALESIKVEGGIPYDERHEIIRALRDCPLQKVSIIGVSWPVCDTWSTLPLEVADQLRDDEWNIEEPMFWQTNAVEILQMGETLEHLTSQAYKRDDREIRERLAQGIRDRGFIDQDIHISEVIVCPEAEYSHTIHPPFIPQYGRLVANIIQTLAATQASTITELKFCGFNGALALHDPIPNTSKVLHSLRHFHNLQLLITAVWMPTSFSNRRRGQEISLFWDDRSVDATPSSHQRETLEKYYEPSLLAQKVSSLIGGFLSQEAISRKGGVVIKALFFLQEDHCNDLYEMEVVIGKDREVVSFLGPRGENNEEREREKLLRRGWF